MEPCGPDTASGLGAWLGDVLTGTNAAQTLCDSCTNIECTTDNEDVNSVDWTDFDLEGTIPSIIGSLSKLVSLELGRNQLSGTIPPWIASMSVLTNLELSLNDLTGSLPPALGSAKSIRRLLADANYLTGVVPQSFASLTSMYVVSLGDNQLSSTLPHSWHNLRRLIYLELANGMLETETRNCTYRSRCCSNASSYIKGVQSGGFAAGCNTSSGGLGFGVLSCEAFWTPWSNCSRFCDGGNQTRSFFNNSDVYNLETLTLTWESVEDFVSTQCDDHEFGDTAIRSCPPGVAGHERCADYACHGFWTNWTECTCLLYTSPSPRDRG